MKSFAILILLSAATVACAGRQTQRAHAATQEPVTYSYRVKAEYPHAADSYTQGLQYVDGRLLEGTGQNGQSRLLYADLESGRTQLIASLPNSEFGEGVTLLGDKIYQLTWMNNAAHVYDRRSGRKIADLHYPGEGWGLTTDGTDLYMSNGTENIYRLDPDTFRRKATVSVTLNGRPLRYLNELEWIEGRIWANVYTTDMIVIIDPATGVVEGVVDLTGLLPQQYATPQTDVLNGIAYDSESKRIFVTGKNWSKLFEIELVEP